MVRFSVRRRDKGDLKTRQAGEPELCVLYVYFSKAGKACVYVDFSLGGPQGWVSGSKQISVIPSEIFKLRN